jgi:hypothetical protein
MTAEKILESMRELDAGEPETRTAVSIEYWGGGGAGAWSCLCDDGHRYITKCQNNGHDGSGKPYKVLTTELICARLGQLFSPPVCPYGCVVNVPDVLSRQVARPDKPSPGASFGSRYAENMIETKAGRAFGGLPGPQQARVVVFQTWLRGQDMAALITADGVTGLSIDHGWYFTGPAWDYGTLVAEPVVNPVLVEHHENLTDELAFGEALSQLEDINESAIIGSCACMPSEWGASDKLRAEVAYFILRRQRLVRGALATLWKAVA